MIVGGGVWKDGSESKCTRCSCRGPRFKSHGSQSSITQFLKILLSFDLSGREELHVVYTYMQAKYSYIKLNTHIFSLMVVVEALAVVHVFNRSTQETADRWIPKVKVNKVYRVNYRTARAT